MSDERCGWQLDIWPPYVCVLKRGHTPELEHLYERELHGVVRYYDNDCNEIDMAKLIAAIADALPKAMADLIERMKPPA